LVLLCHSHYYSEIPFHHVSLPLGFHIYAGQGSHQVPTPREHGVVSAPVLFCSNLGLMSSDSEHIA
jgi:hypothetical protein